MTPTPKQNAKRETPRTDAIICQWSESANPNTPDLAHYRQGCEALEAHAKDLETELQQLRLAADGMAAEIEASPHDELCRSVVDAEILRRKKIRPCDCWKSRATAAYRAAVEGKPKDTGTSRE